MLPLTNRKSRSVSKIIPEVQIEIDGIERIPCVINWRRSLGRREGARPNPLAGRQRRLRLTKIAKQLKRVSAPVHQGSALLFESQPAWFGAEIDPRARMGGTKRNAPRLVIDGNGGAFSIQNNGHRYQW